MTIDTHGNLYLTTVGKRAIGIIPAQTRRYRRFAADKDMVRLDGLTYSTDGYMYSGAAQLPLSAPLDDGKAENKAPCRVYRFRPLAPGVPGF